MDSESLNYSNFERLPIGAPVDRITFIAELCRGRRVLDIGCLDETALVKRDTDFWLHSRICAVASEVLGVDNSSLIPEEGLVTAANGRIVRGDAAAAEFGDLDGFEPEIIVSGEFIEHIADPSRFMRGVAVRYAGRTLVMSTPNGCSFSNTMMGILGREVQHPDHLHNFTFKTLNTMCMRAGFRSWEIVPYRFFATELILRSSGTLRVLAIIAEKCIRAVERLFPALSFGYVVVART